MSELEELMDEFEPEGFEPFWRRPGTSQNSGSLLKAAQVEENEYNLQDILSSGVYALCHKGTVVYVGKAKILIKRIYAHYGAMEQVRKGKKPFGGTKGFIFNKVRIFPCSIEELASLERTLIARFRPKHNERLVPKLLGKMTLEQVGFRYEKLGITKSPPVPRPTFTHKRRF